MNAEIFSGQPAESDFETEWFPTAIEDFNREKTTTVSIQVVWDNITGTPDGTIDLFAANQEDFPSCGDRYNINSVSNIDDSLIIILDSAFRFIKLKYSKNDITGGELSAYIYYESKGV